MNFLIASILASSGTGGRMVAADDDTSQCVYFEYYQCKQPGDAGGTEGFCTYLGGIWDKSQQKCGCSCCKPTEQDLINKALAWESQKLTAATPRYESDLDVDNLICPDDGAPEWNGVVDVNLKVVVDEKMHSDRHTRIDYARRIVNQANKILRQSKAFYQFKVDEGHIIDYNVKCDPTRSDNDPWDDSASAHFRSEFAREPKYYYFLLTPCKYSEFMDGAVKTVLGAAVGPGCSEELLCFNPSYQVGWASLDAPSGDYAAQVRGSTFVHEVCHMFGLQHTAIGVMRSGSDPNESENNAKLEFYSRKKLCKKISAGMAAGGQCFSQRSSADDSMGDENDDDDGLSPERDNTSSTDTNTAPTGTNIAPTGVKHIGEECWNTEGCRSGPCTFCGTGNCCRKGAMWSKDGCTGMDGGEHQHQCVTPAKSIGSSVQDINPQRPLGPAQVGGEKTDVQQDDPLCAYVDSSLCNNASWNRKKMIEHCPSKCTEAKLMLPKPSQKLELPTEEFAGPVDGCSEENGNCGEWKNNGWCNGNFSDDRGNFRDMCRRCCQDVADARNSGRALRR